MGFCKMKKIFLLALLVSSFTYGESYSDTAAIKGMTVGEGYSRIKLSSMNSTRVLNAAESICEKHDYYYLDTSVSKDMYSALLAANASKQTVSLQLIGCQGGYPKISHVYLCERAFCQ